MAILYESRFNEDIKKLRAKDKDRYRIIEEMLDRIDNKCEAGKKAIESEVQ